MGPFLGPFAAAFLAALAAGLTLGILRLSRRSLEWTPCAFSSRSTSSTIASFLVWALSATLTDSG